MKRFESDYVQLNTIDNGLYRTSGIEKGIDLRRSCFVEHVVFWENMA